MTTFQDTVNQASTKGKVFLLGSWFVLYGIKVAFYLGLTYWAVLGLKNSWSVLVG